MSDEHQHPGSDDAEEGNLLPQLSLPAALSIVIVVAATIVSFSYLMYWRNPDRKYDIARPGQTGNQALAVDDLDIDPATPVDGPAAKKKIDFLNQEISAVSGMNKFNPDDLSDQNLQLTPTEQPSY